MKAKINCERQYTPECALEIITKEMSKLNLDVSYRYVGGEIKTYQCFIHDSKWQHTFVGCGKGIGLQSKVSATYEAFEHYYCYTKLLHTDRDNITFMPPSKANHIDALIGANRLPGSFLDPSLHPVALPWIDYQCFTSNSSYYYPLFLIEPRYIEFARFDHDQFDYEALGAIGCDSGTASGTSFEEAAIHALSECIERDAVSLFLAKTFIKKRPIELISKFTLPHYLQKYVKTIEDEFNDNLAIINITSELNVPTFCVSFTQQNMTIQPRGYGTSLNKGYAIERALLESLQPLHLRTDNLNHAETNTLKRLSDFPLLQDAAVANIGRVIDDKRFTERAFQAIDDSVDLNHAALRDKLEKLIQILQLNHYTPHFKLVSDVNSNVVCIKVIIPQFDDFFLVQLGKKILPSQRIIARM